MKKIILKKQHIILTSLFLIFLLNGSYKLHSSRVSGVFFGEGIVHLHTSTTFEKTYKNAPKEYKKLSRIEKKAFKNELKKQLKMYFNEKGKTREDLRGRIIMTIFMLLIALAAVALLYSFVKLIIFLIGIKLILLILAILALTAVGVIVVLTAVRLIYYLSVWTFNY